MAENSNKWRRRFWVLFAIFGLFAILAVVIILQLKLVYSVAEDAVARRMEDLSELNDALKETGKTIHEVGSALSELDIELYGSDSVKISIDSLNKLDSTVLIDAEAKYDQKTNSLKLYIKP